MGLTSQQRPFSNTNDPSCQTDSCPQLRIPRQARQRFPSSLFTPLSEKLHLPELAPSRPPSPTPPHDHPCTSSKTSQSPGLAGDTSYPCPDRLACSLPPRSGPGRPRTPRVPRARGPLAWPLPRLPTQGAKSSGLCLQAPARLQEPRALWGEQKGAAAGVQDTRQAGRSGQEARGPTGSRLPWPGLSSPAPLARASAACPHLIQVLVAAAVFRV